MISRSSWLFLLLTAFLAWTPPAAAQQPPQTVSAGESTNTIVLPPKLIAGKTATLAVIGADGHLAPGVNVDISGGQHLVTDATGRAIFTAPSTPGVLFAKISGLSSAAAVILPAPPTGKITLTGISPIISSRDRFTLLGTGFQGEADANHVEVGEKTALVLAASPVALVVLTAPRISPGQQRLTVRTDAGTSSTTTTLVELSLETGGQAITPHEKIKLVVRVLGSDQSLTVEARSLAPEVVRILGENPQRVQTSGGAENTASIDIEGVQAGDFGFRVRLISPPAGSPDLEAAKQYLEAAERIAPKEEKRKVQKCLSRLQKNKNVARVRADIEKMLAVPSGDFTILLDSARKSLITP
jgi:hypothetical protein